MCTPSSLIYTSRPQLLTNPTPNLLKVERVRPSVPLLRAGTGSLGDEIRGRDVVGAHVETGLRDLRREGELEAALGRLGDGPRARGVGAGAVGDGGQAAVAGDQRAAGDACLGGLAAAGGEGDEVVAALRAVGDAGGCEVGDGEDDVGGDGHGSSQSEEGGGELHFDVDWREVVGVDLMCCLWG